MALKPEAHPKLNDQEYAIAAIAGLGLTLAIAAGMFAAFGGYDNLLGMSLTSVFVVGMVLIGIGFALWMIGIQPWHNFDDLQTPYYTGHDHHDEEHHHAEDDGAGGAHSETHVDDLEIIEGIGTQAKAALVAAGITSFSQLAQSDETTLSGIVKEAKLSLLKPSSWKKQAQYVVDGDVEGFENYKKQLKGGTIDDLEKIEGIGPKVKAALVAAGITTFGQLAAAKVEDVRQIMQTANLKLAKPDTWAKQAQLILDGDAAAFEAYKQKLRGGVEVD